MLELSRDGEHWRLGYGGDTLNTAIHMARAGIETGYFTAVGSDRFSRDMVGRWAAEGLDLSLVMTHPARNSGLYAIETDAEGERSFSYWRDSAAAREMFALPETDSTIERTREASLLSFSLITLAILPPSGRERLFEMARAFRDRGAIVAFDGNYRPRLWDSVEEARLARDQAIACADIGLPTFEDEAALSGERSPAEVSRRWEELGCGEVVVKLGAEGCRLPDGRICAPPAELKPIDTSGAGDAFNGGYLSARLKGACVEDAALAGHALAGWTIMRPGAIPPLDS